MSNFWNNLLRYPLFFVSSLVGLIFVILQPVRNLFRTKRFRLVLPVSILFLLVLLYWTLVSMTSS